MRCERGQVSNKKSCVVLVTNQAYLRKALGTVWELRIFGRFLGTVVLIIGEDLKGQENRLRKSWLGITPKYFPEMDRAQEDLTLRNLPGTETAQIDKTFQFHKFFCFAPYFKRWKKVLYIDANMKIQGPLAPIVKLPCRDKIIAHSDSYPDFKSSLIDQFNFADFPNLRSKLTDAIGDVDDYFQTTMMLFDTAIITNRTVEELQALARLFPNSRTNDQGILNVWAIQQELWVPLPTGERRGLFLYDFHERPGFPAKNYRMIKYPRTNNTRLLRRISEKLFALYFRRFCREFNRTRATAAISYAGN